MNKLWPIALVLSSSLAFGQMTMVGVENSAGTVYQGPGDVVSGATAFWSFRCYTTAYTGNVADIFDSATGSTTETKLTCSAGGIINQTINPLSTTCASGCKVKTMYDQTGNGFDMVQATNANRPTMNLTGTPHSHLTAVCGGSPVAMATTISYTTATPQPFTVSAEANRTSGTSQQTIFSFQADNAQFDFGGANVIEIFGNTAFQTGSQTDGSFHAFVGLFNGASSLINIDGTDSGTGTNIGPSQVNNGTIFLCSTSVPNNFLIGDFSEGGVWASGFNGTQRTNMANNMVAYW